MKVELIGCVPSAEYICATAMKMTKAPDKDSFREMYEAMSPKEAKKYISLAIELGHESVLEHAGFTFIVEDVSRALTHQLVRHRIASYTQQSQRYVKLDKPVYIEPSFDYVSDEFAIDIDFRAHMDKVWELYRDMLKMGAKPEDARFILPGACTTKIVVTMNARELRHFFKLRCSKHAQWEIREMANKMLKLCFEYAPMFFEDLMGGNSE